LTPESALELRSKGYTMVVAKRGFFDAREISLSQLLPPR
jgi:hypothetical protein